MSKEDYIVEIPLEIVNATSRGGYFALYLKYRTEGLTIKQAWQKVEGDLSAHGLPGRYSTFKSFLNNTHRLRKEVKEWRRSMLFHR